VFSQTRRIGRKAPEPKRDPLQHYLWFIKYVFCGLTQEQIRPPHIGDTSTIWYGIQSVAAKLGVTVRRKRQLKNTR
jgi:hypothetical protein